MPAPAEDIPTHGYPAPPGWTPPAPAPVPTAYPHYPKQPDAAGAGPSQPHAPPSHVRPALVSEVTAAFITLLDALALNQNAVADLMPLLQALCSALEQVRTATRPAWEVTRAQSTSPLPRLARPLN